MTVRFELHGSIAFAPDSEFIVFDPNIREPIPYVRDGAFIDVDDAYRENFSVMKIYPPRHILEDTEQLAMYRRYCLGGLM